METSPSRQVLTYDRHSWPLRSWGSLPTVTRGRGIRIYCLSPWTRDTQPIAEHLTVKLSLPVFTTQVYRGWDSINQPSSCDANALSHCAPAAADKFEMYCLFTLPWHWNEKENMSSSFYVSRCTYMYLHLIMLQRMVNVCHISQDVQLT